MESCIVMILLCLILFGLLQVSVVTAAYDVFVYAATAGARCATIGYNDTMVAKTIRAAALPNMGPKQIGLAEELYGLKNYLKYAGSAADKSLLSHIPDTYWHSFSGLDYGLSGDTIEPELVQEYPLTFPFVGAFYSETNTEFSVEDLDMRLENHSDLYLDNS